MGLDVSRIGANQQRSELAGNDCFRADGKAADRSKAGESVISLDFHDDEGTGFAARVGIPEGMSAQISYSHDWSLWRRGVNREAVQPGHEDQVDALVTHCGENIEVVAEDCFGIRS